MSRAAKSKAPIDITVFPSNLPENSTYFGSQIPVEVKVAIPAFHAAVTNSDDLKSLLSVVTAYIASEPERFSLEQDDAGEVDQIVQRYHAQYGQDWDQANLLLTALYFCFRTAVRNKVKISIVRRDLTAMHVPELIVNSIVEELQKMRPALEGAIIAHAASCTQYHKLEKLRWRVDVTISSGSLTRVMRPYILMQMIMKDGKIVTFEVSMEQFNQLRYNVAKVLHEMQTLERHPIIRIVNEFKRREEEEYNT